MDSTNTQKSEDLSRYTVGASAPAPTQDAETEGFSGFGVDPRKRFKEKVPLEVINKRLYILSIFLTIIVILLTSFIFYLRVNTKPETKISEEIKNISTNVESPTPIPNKDESLEPSEISIEVLNATGISGEAQKFADKLEKSGFKISKVSNAEGVHKGIKLYASEELSSKSDSLLKLIQKDLEDATYAGVEKELSSGARIILGK